MFEMVDLYLGIFLVVSGFGIALINLRSVLTAKGKVYNVLLSENIVLMCIGLAFLCRAIYSLQPMNMGMEEFEERMISSTQFGILPCGFPSLVLSYGPLTVSMVNSFLSLVIDNYMHYQFLAEESVEGNAVEDLRETDRALRVNSIIGFLKRNLSYITIIVQWLIPIITALSMYPLNIQEVSMREMRSLQDSCVSVLDLNKCSVNYTIPILDYIETPDYMLNDYKHPNKSEEIDSVLNNVFKILNNYNHTDLVYAQTKTVRIPKSNDCMKICLTDNRNILLYMFIIACICFFIPVTVSTVILTRIHTMEIKKNNIKRYISRDILYNLIFWSPVMFDTFFSLLLCSFSTQSTRTSLFNTIANMYQVVKNFINTKRYRDNVIVPV